jgi:hypothetical protein
VQCSTGSVQADDLGADNSDRRRGYWLLELPVASEFLRFRIAYIRRLAHVGADDQMVIDAEVAGSADELREGTCQMRKPSETFRQFIEPAYDDYLKDPLSERLANNLAAALDHQVDWTFSYYKAVDPSRLDGAPEVKFFRRKLSVQCQPLQIMNDLADAAFQTMMSRLVEELGNRVYARGSFSDPKFKSLAALRPWRPS